MGQALKGSIQQYLQGLLDSSYGITHIYQLDKKVTELNRIKQQRIQNEMLARRQRVFGGRRSLRDRAAIDGDLSARFKKEPRLLGRIALSAMMSSLICISIWGFNAYLMPMLRYQSQKVFPQSSVDGQTHWTRRVWNRAEDVLEFTFSSLWVLPLYIISKIVNGFWFGDVSNSVFHLYHGKPRAFPSIGRMVADFIYGLLVNTVFLVQAMLVRHIPFIPEISFVLFYIHHCLLYALYAFEYKWFNMGLDIRIRISMVETHWPYFCGFGTPLFVLTSVTFRFYPTVISACVFSLLFPFFIISATRAGTPSETPAARLPVFDLSLSICNALCNVFLKSSANARAEPGPSTGNQFYSRAQQR